MSNSPLGGLLLISQPEHTTRGGVFDISKLLLDFQVNLTKNNVMSDTVDATAKSVVRISLLNQRAQKRSFDAFFLCPSFMVGCVEAFSNAAFLFGAKANSAQSASILISLIGGSSQANKERAIMPSTISPRPVASNSISDQIQDHISDLLALSEAVAFLDPKETPDGTISALASIQLRKLGTLGSLIDSLGVRA